MSLLIISASLNPESNSRVLAREAERVLRADGASVEFLDLRDLPLPMCDGDQAYGHPHVERGRAAISRAHGVMLASPIYNYDVNAAAKNLIELTGKAWENKVVGFLCTAGGAASYMSVMSIANSLMLDFRCVIVPRFVYATGQCFDGETISDAKIAARVVDCARALAKLAAINKT